MGRLSSPARMFRTSGHFWVSRGTAAHLVPDDKNTTEILINTIGISTMMDPMVGGGVEDDPQWPVRVEELYLI